MKEHYDKQSEETENQQKMLENKTNKKSISRPNIAPPTYTAKVPRK
jgi:hypothetical protein